MRVVVVIPTYNEVENISKIIPVLLEHTSKLKEHDIHVLVVDGNSPDGTGDAVLDMSDRYPNVHLLLEKKKAGLGAAYMQAFEHAMKDLDADVLVEMDADFQHNPKDVVKFVREIDKGADYVIGSRFTKGGSIPKNWAFYRKFLSWGGNLFSKIVLGIFSVNDFTSGFKASRVKGFVDQLDTAGVLSQGFAYKIDLLYKMQKMGAKIVEVPIAFGLRDRGDSKMERNNFIDSLKVVVMLRVKDSISFIKFTLVGFMGLFTDLGVFNLLASIIAANIASLVSGFIAMFVTFLFNNFWSFNHNKITKKRRLLKSLLVYYAFSYMPVIFRSWLVKYAVHTYGDSFASRNISFLFGVFVGLIWNFTVYSKVIWKKRPH